jgi:pimeloyl-ACP methyl ester carboxylesterase
MPEEHILIGNHPLAVFRSKHLPGRPTLVFLHDSLGCIALWRDFPNQLAEATRCNVLVYDRHGYGKSHAFESSERRKDYLELEAEVLKDLLEACQIEEAILFGHSDGGSIALIAAAKFPQRIKAILVEGAHIFVEELTLAGIRQAVQAYRTTNLKSRLEQYHGDKTDHVFQAWAQTWLRPDYRYWTIEPFLPMIQCPVLVIQGEKDEYGTLLQVNGITSGVCGPVFQYIVPQAGHTPHKEAAPQTLQRATKFIQEQF